jgi:cobalt-zinc-cadmium efflux system outer membrane protein
MRLPHVRFAILTLVVCLATVASGRSALAQAASPVPSPAPAPVQASVHGPVKITLDDAIQMALAHNHTLLAARTTIQQSEAQETTANLRPNPVLLGDAQFLPLFQPDQSPNYLDESAQFDLGLSYLFERGRKRQHRLQAAQDQTAVTRSQVSDNERTLSFQVASQFTNAQLAESVLELALQDQNDFQKSVDISKERYRAGDISEDDYLKIKLQLLQFQTDASQARLAKVQALSDLRRLLGYESVSADYDVAGPFDYLPVSSHLEDLQVQALATRPDLRAAQQGVTAANSQLELAKANGKQDVTGQISYTHTGDLSTASLFGQIQIPIFNRNQGEIARTGFAITQAQEQEKAASEQVLDDVQDAYAGLRTNDEIIQLYRSGYLDDAQQDRDISEYSYKRGAASLLDYLDAERSYRATELAYRQALASYLLAVEQLREAVGTRSVP